MRGNDLIAQARCQVGQFRGALEQLVGWRCRLWEYSLSVPLGGILSRVPSFLRVQPFLNGKYRSRVGKGHPFWGHYLEVGEEFLAGN